MDDVSMGVEAHDLHTHRGSATGFDLVFVAEEVDSSFATTVVQTALDEDTEHCRFAGVDIANDSDACFDDIFRGAGRLTDEELAVRRGVFSVLGS